MARFSDPSTGSCSRRHVRSMVLDGAVDANLSLPTDATLEAPAIQTALEHVFASCPTTSGCTLGPDPAGFYERLAAQLTRTPLPAPGDGDNAPVTVGDLMTATLLYLSAPRSDLWLLFLLCRPRRQATAPRCVQSHRASRPT